MTKSPCKTTFLINNPEGIASFLQIISYCIKVPTYFERNLLWDNDKNLTEDKGNNYKNSCRAVPRGIIADDTLYVPKAVVPVDPRYCWHCRCW